MTTSWKFDLGGGGVASGFTGVSAGDAYNASKGYGFAQTNGVSNVSAGGSGAGSDAVKFNNGDAGNTFNVDLPKGLYQIKVTTGNSPRTTINMQGMPQMINLTGNNAVESIQIPITEGKLSVQAVAGMSGREYSISAIEINQINTTAETRPTIWICGDSTVCNYYNCSDASQHGWGQFLGDYVDTNMYEIRNQAESGQFAKGFINSGRFKAIEYYGKAGDIYLISIGINDTNKNYTTEEEYIASVTEMVQKAKAKGISVYLVKQQGRRSDLSRSPLLTGRWFGGDLDKIGQSENVPVIDLFTPWQEFGLSVGFDGMKSYYATKNDGTEDDLHQSKKGAQKLAEIMSGLFDVKAITALAPEAGTSFMIKNVNSGLYLEVADGKAENNANVQQGEGNEPTAYNTWTFTQQVGDYYYIGSNLDGGNKYFLYVLDGSRVNGGNIVIAEKNGYSDQYFKMMDNGDDTCTIYTRASRDACVMEVVSAKTESGANVQQWEKNGHACQKWILEKVDYSAQEGKLKLKPRKKGKAKEVIHFMVPCSHCKSIIKGIRYKCKNCKNIDFCERCIKEKKKDKEHLEHKFEEILESEFPKTVQPKNINYLQRKNIHQNERCNACGMFPIIGIRYKCAICDDFNFCEDCEKVHGTMHDHPLIKLSSSLMEDKFNRHYCKIGK